MNDPSTVITTTFVVRFWHEWSGGEARWRGRIEHVESGRRADFLGVEGLMGFLERFGICAGAHSSKSGMDRAADG